MVRLSIFARRLFAGLALSLAAGSAAMAATACTTRPGQGGLVIEARVLTERGAFEEAQVLIGADGPSACVGAACAAHWADVADA